MSVRGRERVCVSERGRERECVCVREEEEERECVRERQKDFRMCLTVGSSVQMKDVFRLITQLTEKVFFSSRTFALK